ncbi:hypothetical protein B0H63DRAFT_277071 [Podospora didyma]|uniref:Uncharacterized protein n=1 Tax=Podospora didyma TaxID=330526 RepID=A0AAE0KES8_9PEZI|nr:hypothetical protein B0H63DRAFT_277071 [Podospora didyma]
MCDNHPGDVRAGTSESWPTSSPGQDDPTTDDRQFTHKCSGYALINDKSAASLPALYWHHIMHKEPAYSRNLPSICPMAGCWPPLVLNTMYDGGDKLHWALHSLHLPVCIRTACPGTTCLSERCHSVPGPQMSPSPGTPRPLTLKIDTPPAPQVGGGELCAAQSWPPAGDKALPCSWSIPCLPLTYTHTHSLCAMCARPLESGQHGGLLLVLHVRKALTCLPDLTHVWCNCMQVNHPPHGPLERQGVDSQLSKQHRGLHTASVRIAASLAHLAVIWLWGSGMAAFKNQGWRCALCD